MAERGQLYRVKLDEFEWKIHGFSSIDSQSVQSPSFSHGGESWYLSLSPNGSKGKKSSGFLDIFLYRTTPGWPFELQFSLGLKTYRGPGRKYHDIPVIYEFPMKNGYWGDYKVISRSELYERKSDFFPYDILTVFCTLWQPYYYEEGTTYYEKEKCSYCKLTVDLDDCEDMSSHQKKCMNKPIKCPECGDVVLLKNWFEHECENTDVEESEIVTTENQAASEKPVAAEKLLVALNRIMHSGEHSDTTIKVKGEDFRLHKNILGARSPFFDLMFKNEMKENITGIVTIDDCEPDTFRSYIHFLYTGKVDHISAANVCDLYAVADKYQDEQLKKECSHFMMNSISLDNFCDYTILAFTYKEQKLLNNVIEIFAHKTKEIIRSVHWQTFLLKYPIQANELHIKALDLNSVY